MTSLVTLPSATSTTPTNATFRTGGLRRAGTLVRNPLQARKDKDKDKRGTEGLSAAEVTFIRSSFFDHSLRLSL
jgi:hypothetical protein